MKLATAPTAFRLYVIEIDRAACKKSTCPQPRSGKRHVYVGASAKAPEERFAEHLDGIRSVRVVREFGVRLLPRLYRNRGPYETRREAEAAERHLAEHLRNRGYCVFGGH